MISRSRRPWSARGEPPQDMMCAHCGYVDELRGFKQKPDA